jgi:peptidoglycan hydrolase CwlO-like protein
MNKIIRKTLFLFCFLALIISLAGFVQADDSDRLKELTEKIREYETKISELQGQQKTLSSTISYLNNKIYLTEIQIQKTNEEINILKEEIDKLSVKINQLDKSLDEISKILSERIGATYKSSHLKPIYLLFSSENFTSFFSKLQYLKFAQENDRLLMYQMEQQKINFDKQKNLKEQKQEKMKALKKTLEVQEASLAQQKIGKQQLLEITKNDEKKFQELLAAARAEMEAIQSIIAGKGQETIVGDISAGSRIASIISGASACSTGTHLHFEVIIGGVNVNPASVLKSQDVDWDLCGWYGCDESFSFSGSWDWPVNGRPRITQGFGMTAYARSGAYGGRPHSGLDMVSEDLQVKAVKEGKLYRGSIPCGGGTLRYVKVVHKDGSADTYYLHVNYY